MEEEEEDILVYPSHPAARTPPSPASSTTEQTQTQNPTTGQPSTSQLNRNHIPSPIITSACKLDQFKNSHYHLDRSAGDTNNIKNIPIEDHHHQQHPSLIYRIPPSAAQQPHSAPIIHTDTNHLQSENVHLQFTPSSGFQKDTKVAKDIKRRTTKACDNCRKSKCKCTRAPDSNGLIPSTGPCQNCVTNAVECTFNGTSRKRGPPKGYIEAIESRLHRMEALLGGLLENDDPRAQALFSELIGDNEVRDLLTSDLKIAAQQGTDGKPRKSWKPPDPSLLISSSSDRRSQQQLNLTDTQKVLWGVSHLNQTSPDHPSHDSCQPNGQLSDPEDDSECEGSQADPSPPPPHPHDDDSTNMLHKNRRRRLGSHLPSIHRPKSQVTPFNQASSSTTTIPHTGTATFTLSHSESTTNNNSQFTFECNQSLRPPPNTDLTSTKQHSPATISELADVVGQLSLDENDEVRYHGRSSGLYLISASQRYKDFFWHFPKPGFWPVAPIRRSPTTLYILDLANPIELLPSEEMMNHLLDLYWAFVHPMIPILYKPEFMTQFSNLMANVDIVKRARPHWSLNQIWCHAMCRNSSSTDESLSESSEQHSPPSIHQQDQSMDPPVSGLEPTHRISILLLLVIFSISSRYSDRSSSSPTEGQYWCAGDNYLEKAKQVLNLDYGNSKLTNCQSLILMAYREIGSGAMTESWLYTGMAIRMAQDMGLFRDVDKWFMPVKKFTYEDKQIRKRVWWACVNMDKYVSTYIGRPMMIFERDYDTAFPSTNEPDEHESWKGCTPKRSSLELSPPAHSDYRNAAQGLKVEEGTTDPMTDCPATEPDEAVEQKSHTMSCFNRAASLSVLISRIVANIYAIRIRVIGQSSETLLSLLDQNLARWYLELPEQLHYRPQSIPSRPTPTKSGGSKGHGNEKRAPTPHLLTLHAQFYTALILLHRPFIPAPRSQDNSDSSSTDPSPPHPSQNICTTAANAITNIAQAYHEAFGLRQAPAFLVYYIFTAAILHVNNARSETGLAPTAKSNLLKCMNSLKEMAPTWTGAVRAWELLSGLVDLRDVDLLDYKQQHNNQNTPKADGKKLKKPIQLERGLKRPASSSDLEHHMLHPRADQRNFTSSSAKSTTPGNSLLLGTPASTVQQNSRWGPGKPIAPLRPIAPLGNAKSLRSISTSDWSTVGMNSSIKIDEDSMNTSPHLTQQAHSGRRSTDDLGMGLHAEKRSSRCEIGSSTYPPTSSNQTVLPSSTGAAKNEMLNLNHRASRDILRSEGDTQCLHGPPALPTTAMEEMIGFWGSNRNPHAHYPQPPNHQTLQQQQSPCSSNVNQALSPLLYDLTSFTANPSGNNNSSYGSLNDRDFRTTTIQGIFGLGADPRTGIENLRTINDHVVGPVKDQDIRYPNRDECGRVVENSNHHHHHPQQQQQQQQQQRQRMGENSLGSSNDHAHPNGTFSDLDLNWFSSPVETINNNEFRIDPISPTMLTPSSHSHHSTPAPIATATANAAYSLLNNLGHHSSSAGSATASHDLGYSAIHF
ncbi:hypothetical protein Pst134EA_027733 [Puccinia striiformis f. sp. tritici]|uniref:hypothetical protein n=1 Tax=Puccinia striiformis f. sp. tritici TaxID=168172 RepID=UPI0020072186|nr:hypothetical protein Pst134EA_027733 [Puccinia striiformis f. sp. tritici]KAH9448422.1 hypothetical protein Pst134EA_027733 [Puccinia striiformis f. sp. tritici]